MRPLKLIFEGLNSFEQRQTIDFEKLTAARLFGIFGPTGAGKSTIMDAITLALFGEVDRAERGTRGIININRDSLYVDFTFSVGKGDDTRVYRVERSYVRVKNKDGDNTRDSINVKKVGLYQIDDEGEHTITAEKSSVATDAVETILGLNMNDFVHSVVLVQGKFADFIKMRGAERIEMLERIFSLEAYGAELRPRVDERLKQLNTELSEVRGHLSELGEMSDEQLYSAKVELQKCLDQKDDVDTRARQAQTAAAALAEKHKLYQERLYWAAEKQKLDAQCARFDALRAERDAARRAAVVLPLSAQLDETNSRLVKLGNDVNVGERAVKSAMAMLNLAIKDVEERTPVETERRNKMMQRAGALQQMLPREAGMRAQIQQRRQQQRALDDKQRELSANSEKLAETRQRIDALQAGLAELEARRASQSAADLDALRRGSEAEALCARAEADFKQASEKSAALSSERDAAANKQQQASNALADAQRAFEAADAQLKRAEAAFEQFKLQNSAAYIAHSVVEGQPCPVCGSVHHPALAVLPEGEVAEPAAEREAREAAHARYMDARNAMSIAQSELDMRLQRLAEQSAETERLSAALSLAQQTCAALRGETGASDMTQAYKAALQAISEREKLQSEIDLQNKKLSNAKASEQETVKAALLLNGEIEKLSADIERIDRETSNWAGELGALGLNLDANIAQEMEKAQQEAEDAGRRLQKLTVVREECMANCEEAKRRLAGTRSALQEQSDNRDRLIAQLANALQANNFADLDAAKAAARTADEFARIEAAITEYDTSRIKAEENLKRLIETAPDPVSEEELKHAEVEKAQALQKQADLNAQIGALSNEVERMQSLLAHKKELDKQAETLERNVHTAEELKTLLRGNALVKYIAQQYLAEITVNASDRLEALSSGKYRLVLNVERDNEFLICDLQNGGILRPTTTLSGGETFLVSLSLALSLSLHLTLGGRDLDFFFLDEGFGTLDNSLLDDVMKALEKLSRESFAIGVISHVESLKERIPVQLSVSNDRDSGSHVKIQYL